MNRRGFLKLIGAVTSAVAAPITWARGALSKPKAEPNLEPVREVWICPRLEARGLDPVLPWDGDLNDAATVEITRVGSPVPILRFRVWVYGGHLWWRPQYPGTEIVFEDLDDVVVTSSDPRVKATAFVYRGTREAFAVRSDGSRQSMYAPQQ